MSAERQKILVEKLIEKTILGNVEWKTTIHDDVFQVTFSKSSLNISREESSGDYDYYISLINSNGQIADSFSDVNLDQSAFEDIPSWFSKMRDLYSAARRKALGSDEVLENLISEIDDLLPF